MILFDCMFNADNTVQKKKLVAHRNIFMSII